MSNIRIQQKIEKQVKNKSYWKTIDSTDYEDITLEKYNNIIDIGWIRLLRNMGGIETIQKNYTPLGYMPIKILSTSPDRENRTIRYFRISYID